MAIAKIKRLEIIGLQQDKDKFLALLQKLGRVEIVNIQQEIGATTVTIITAPHLLEIEEAISYLMSFKEKSGFLEGIVNLKPLVFQRQLNEVVANFDYLSLLKELSSLRNHLNNLSHCKERLNQERQLLEPWHRLSIPLDEIHYTQYCGIILGILSSRDYVKLLNDIEKESLDVSVEVVNQNKANTYTYILYIKEDFERLEAILKNYHFNFVTLTRHKITVRERLYEINRESLLLDDEIDDIKDKIVQASKQQFKLMMVYDYLANIKNMQEADRNLVKQQYTFSLSGWMRGKDIKLLEREVNTQFKDLAIFISEPVDEVNIPVILENKPIIQPFEFITNIYGMPKYNELDPTPFLAPFFFLYFGFCISDVGYGLILILVSWFVLKRFKMGPQGVRFFRLFLFCGISTIIIGALTGSWFGNLFDLLGETNKIFLPLKRFKDSMVLIDPLKEPTKLLGIALMFGIIQVWFGNIVAAIGNIKNKRYLDIILDQIPMLTLLFGLTGWGLIFLKLSSRTYISLFKYTILIGGIGLIFTQGRSEKGVGSKLFYGVYNLYNALSGYLSDVLSYSRLWALGLVTGVMAGTINLIAVQFNQIVPSVIPFINKISFIKIIISGLVLSIIFVFGHGVSLLMNLLGAFVHPLRLQFVEFFSKFFKSGGNTFKPFKVETKYINLG